MQKNPRSKSIDFAAVGLALFVIGLAGFLACHAVLALSRPFTAFDNKPEVGR